MELLKRVWPENRDYHQGLGYICSLLMLVFDSDTTQAMLLQLTRAPKYTPGYWRASAIQTPALTRALTLARNLRLRLSLCLRLSLTLNLALSPALTLTLTLTWTRRAAPEPYVRDAMVYARLVQEREPEVAKLLHAACIVPEAYASKVRSK
tara:strand:- start:339 stop:791 length:453 start_codon:yes stop_codon:yes gene_type:complete